MGGAANLCVILPEGERLSVMAYSDAMASLSLSFEFRNASLDERVRMARKYVEDYSAETKGHYYHKRGLGLSPEWYGIVLIDVVDRRIISCNGYTDPNAFCIAGLALTLRAQEPDELEVENWEKWAASGKLVIKSWDPSVADEPYPRETRVEDWIKAASREMLSGSFEIVDDWACMHFQLFEDALAEVKKRYTLSPEEKKQWQKSIKHYHE